MIVRSVMTHDVQTVAPGANLREVAALMQQFDLGAVPVCEGGHPVGIVTDRDIAVRGVASGLGPDAQARDVMTQEVDTIADYQDIESAAGLMERRQIRRLVVLDRDNCITGMLSLGDLAVKTHDQQLAGEALERVSEPSSPASPAAQS